MYHLSLTTLTFHVSLKIVYCCSVGSVVPPLLHTRLGFILFQSSLMIFEFAERNGNLIIDGEINAIRGNFCGVGQIFRVGSKIFRAGLLG